MNKLVKIVLLCFLSVNLSAQCSDCTSLLEAFKEPEKVITLKVNPWQHDITLDSIPTEIGTLVNAKIIWLSGHNFTSIPKEIGNLKNLRELSFAECQLTEISDELFTLTQLKELIIWENNFSEEYIEELKARFNKEMPRTKVRL